MLFAIKKHKNFQTEIRLNLKQPVGLEKML